MSNVLKDKVKLEPGPSARSKEPECLISAENTETDWKSADLGAIEFYAEVLPASYNQGSSKFGVLAGTQCGSIIATAAVMKKYKMIGTWNSVDLNNVLTIGTDYHSKNDSRNSRNYVDINDCKGVYELDGISFNFTAEDFGVARTSFDNSQTYLKTLEIILDEIIEGHMDVSLVFAGYTFGLFCEQDFVYFFNSHCSTYLENEAWSGSASVLKFDSEIAAEAVSNLIEGAYSPEDKASSNDRTIQISVLTVTKQGD